MAFNTLNRLKWAKELDECEIIIVHRGAEGDRKTITGPSLTEIKKSYFSYKARDKETTIPLHRIIEIRLGGKAVWKRNRRLPGTGK